MQSESIPPAIEEKPKIHFVTSKSYPYPDTSIWFGSTVSARSVRLISQKTTERDSWWAELRHEITKNALSLNCTHILGYREVVSLYEDVMVLNVFGTAVKIKDGKYRKDLKLGAFTRLKSPVEYSPSIDHAPLHKTMSG